VQKSSASSRMVALWKQLRTMRFDLAFRRGEKREEKGFTWAPKTLLRPASGFDTDKTIRIAFNGDRLNHGEAQLSDEGLHFACRGYELQKPFKADISQNILFKTEDEVWHKVLPRPDLGHQVSCKPPPGRGVKLMLFCDQSDAEASGESGWRGGGAQGILVYESELKGDFHHVRLIYHVEFIALSNSGDKQVIGGMEIMKRWASTPQSPFILAGVKQLGSDTKWCLD
jgi:hypothetical protein